MLRINKNDLIKLAGPNILSELTSHWKYGSVIQFPDTFYVDISMNSDQVLIEYFKNEEVKVSFLTMNSKDKYFYVVMALLKALNLTKNINNLPVRRAKMLIRRPMRKRSRMKTNQMRKMRV